MFSTMSYANSIDISVDISLPVAHSGANITANCRVRGVNPQTTISWVKSVTGSDDVEVIATNDVLSPLYEAQNRYDVGMIPLDDVIFYILNIYRTFDDVIFCTK